MKHLLIPALVAVALFAHACDAENVPSDEILLSATMTLRDGSSLKGTLYTDTIKGAAVFNDNLELPAACVKSLSFSNTNGEAKAVLTNGDTLSLKVATSAFDFDSALGRIPIDRTKLSGLTISKCHIAGKNNDGLVFYCTFDDETSVSSPAVGPAGRLVNGCFVPGKTSNALSVQRGLSACEFNFPTGMISGKGCIEFYARFMDGKTEFTTGGDPRFFTFYNAKSRNDAGLFEYASNNGRGNGGLSAVFGDVATTHDSCRSMMPYSDIFKGRPYEDWHHYAVVWNENGIDKFANGDDIPRLVILLDGKNVGTTYQRSQNNFLATLQNNSFLLAIPMQETGPSYNNKSNFLIDDLKIWNFDKTEF